MIKRNFYLLVISLVFSSCNESTSNVDSNPIDVNSTVRVVSSNNIGTEDKEIGIKIEDKCGSENTGIAIIQDSVTHIVCDGQNGQIIRPANKSESLIKTLVDNKCQGSNGLAFYVGNDLNRDGELSENERSLQPEIVCDNSVTTFDITYSEYYSTLKIDDGESAKYVNFYYPKLTILDKGTYCKNGGTRIELFGQDKGTAQPKLDFNETVCNGTDGKTPNIKIIDKNATLTENDKCQKTGGMEVTLLDITSYICNGEIGSFGGELNLTIKKDGGNSYIYDGFTKVSDALTLEDFNIAVRETLISKKASTLACPHGELNVTTYLDINFNHTLDAQETSSVQSEIVCSAEKISASALKVSSATLKADTNLTIDFKFNRPINELSVNNNSVLLVCSSQSEKNIDVPITIDFKINMNTDGVKDFNLTYSKAILPQPTNDVDCQLKISKFVEDTNGVSMHTRFLDDFNFTVQ